MIPQLLALALAAAPTTKVAVLDVRAGGGVAPDSVKGLSGLFAAELAKEPDVSVLTAADVQAMIGFEKQKELLGCSDQSCIAEIGGALGVDLILAGEVSKIGGSWLISLSLVEIKKAQAVARVSRDAPSEDQVVATAREAARELVAAWRGRDGAPAPAAATSAPAVREEKGGSALPWIVLGSGAVVAIVGGVVYGQARSEASAGVFPEEADAVETRGNVGLGALVGGAAVAASSVFFFGSD